MMVNTGCRIGTCGHTYWSQDNHQRCPMCRSCDPEASPCVICAQWDSHKLAFYRRSYWYRLKVNKFEQERGGSIHAQYLGTSSVISRTTSHHSISAMLLPSCAFVGAPPSKSSSPEIIPIEENDVVNINDVEDGLGGGASGTTTNYSHINLRRHAELTTIRPSNNLSSAEDEMNGNQTDPNHRVMDLNTSVDLYSNIIENLGTGRTEDAHVDVETQQIIDEQRQLLLRYGHNMEVNEDTAIISQCPQNTHDPPPSYESVIALDHSRDINRRRSPSSQRTAANIPDPLLQWLAIHCAT